MISPLDKVLRTAIRKRRLIRLVYDGRDRIAEPHDYGIQDGAVRLLAYQVEPPAAWRLFSVSKITDCALLEHTFPAGGPRRRGSTTGGTSSLRASASRTGASRPRAKILNGLQATAGSVDFARAASCATPQWARAANQGLPSR